MQLEDNLLVRPRVPGDDRVFPITGHELEGAWARICKRAGIKNYHIHANRHEGLSATAEPGRAAGTPFDLIALSRLSGHRICMLARYSHLCAGELAERLDEACELAKRRRKHRKGRLVSTGASAPAGDDRISSDSAPAQHDHQLGDHGGEWMPPDDSRETFHVNEDKSR